MKALTLHQPWATLISIGEKRIETRHWATKYRGPIAIHAAKTIHSYAREWWDDEWLEWVLGINGIESTHDMPLGAVVATARLVDCRLMTREYIDETIKAHPAEVLLGHWSVGRFAWVLDDITRLNDPVPARGEQGLWDWSAA